MNRNYPKIMKKKGKSDLLGVSEAIGTVLLLGITVAMTGGIALYTSQIDGMDEGLFVDLYASLSGETLSITHRGGDVLTGTETYITIQNSDGTEFRSIKYFDPGQGRSDEFWESGESLDISLVGTTLDITILVTTVRNDGISIVAMKTELSKSSLDPNSPDLAITRISIQQSGTTGIDGYILDHGPFLIIVNVKNIGGSMTEKWVEPLSDSEVSNLMIYDDSDSLELSSLSYTHRDSSGNVKSPSDMILLNDEYLEIVFTWNREKGDYRALGDHVLTVKVNPYSSSELDYRNNIMTRSYTVDKDTTPEPIPGPDPGIYDIYFSDDAPRSGDTITVTVVVQNSGSEILTPDMNVHLIVSLWAPAQKRIPMVGYEEEVTVYDWMMDDPAHYQSWRMGNDTLAVETDLIFPTCTINDIELLPGAYIFFHFSLEARVDIPGGHQTVYAVVNPYDGYDPVDPMGLMYDEGDNHKDNTGLGIFQVFPKILLVDDDGASSGTAGDMTTIVTEALTGSGVKTDAIVVAQQVEDDLGMRNAPAYQYDRTNVPFPAMEDYDIVIWITGQRTDALTNDPIAAYGGNIQELMKYLDDNGYFLLVGSHPLDGLTHYFNGANNTLMPGTGWSGNPEYEDAQNFIYNYLGIQRVYSGEDLPLGNDDRMVGIDGDEGNITEVDGGGEYNIEFNDMAEFNAMSTLFLPRSVQTEKDLQPYFEIPAGVLTYQDEISGGTETDHVNTVRSWSVPDPVTGAIYKSVVMGWDVREIKYLNQEIDIFARTMKWLDWEIQIGRDLAITKMELSLLSQDENNDWIKVPIDNDEVVPKYLDTIEIEVSVRNNGLLEESTTLIFYVTGPNGIEVPVTTDLPEPRSEEFIPEEKINDNNPIDLAYISGGGGEVTRYKLWLALGSGIYNFRVMVDPYHLIDEVNEDNNDISYSTTTLASFVAENNILIVDDDGSSDNFLAEDLPLATWNGLVINYPLGEPSELIADSLVELDFDHEVFTTENYHDSSDWIMGSGPLVEELKRFNSIIWVSGNSGSVVSLDRETLTDSDIIAIEKYLSGLYDEAQFLGDDHNENLMLTGSHVLEDISGSGDHSISGVGIETSTHEFLRNFLGVHPETTSPPQETGSIIFGARSGSMLSDIYFGLEIFDEDIEGGDFNYQDLTTFNRPFSTVRNAFMTFDGTMNIDTASVQFSHHDDEAGDYFRSVFHSWDLAELQKSGDGSIEHPFQESIFLTLRWFDTPIIQPEILSRNIMVDINHDNPSLGNSYLVSLKVANLGGASGGGTVRFMDGDTLFSTRFIFLDPGDQVTIEAIWEPQYAGNRIIKVWLDRFDDYDEVFDSINNIPQRSITVYYFWDDMETYGSNNFEHDALVAMINGENPLDYYDPLDPDPQTNVIDSWDRSMSYGVREADDTSKSAPYSYRLEESKGAVLNRADVIISFVIDDSASMTKRTSTAGNTWLQEAKDAAQILLNELSDASICVSIWDFKGNAERRWSGPTDRGTSEGGISTTNRRDPVRLGDDFGGIDGRTLVSNEIDSMSNPSGTTIIWDSIGEAYKDIEYWSVYYPDLTPVVVVLSDGMDIQASDGSSLSLLTVDNTVEGGSTYWAPWGSMADGEQYYQYHLGKYSTDLSDLSASTYWMYAMNLGSMDHYRYGLLDSDIPIYTIGLGLEHHDPPYLPEISTNPVTTIGDHILDYTNAHCSATGTGIGESGTLEYNLWRIADSSDAKYFYAPTADELADIFQELGQLLAKPQDQTRSSEPTRQDEVPNENKWAVTSEFDVSGAETASLSFWHKYNIVDGANGGYVMVGYLDDTVDTDADGDPTNDWDWKYMTPVNGFYSGSLYPGLERKDSFGNTINWGYNGRSGEGTFDWDNADFNILDFVPPGYRDRVKVMFYYIQYGGGTGDGWWFDDVKIVMSRAEESPVDADSIDTWRFLEGTTESGTVHSGTHSWFAGGITTAYDLHEGIDNSLYTRPIDLTNARNAYLEFYTRFNIQYEAGRPPDGFRVEISKNNGLSWAPLNFGVRSSWRVSGTEADLTDGELDGKSFTGASERSDVHNWVPASSISRLTLDLGGYTGYVVTLRFRIVTNIDGIHYEDVNSFRGVYLDDIKVFGESLESSPTRSQSMENPDIDEMILESLSKGSDDGSTSEIIEVPEPQESVERAKVQNTLYGPTLLILLLIIISIIWMVGRRLGVHR